MSVRVLVVDDSETARSLLVALLTRHDLEVVGEARDGHEAVASTARLRPDVVVMDVHMPRLDGLEATRRIMVETPTPIVVCTATTDPIDVALSMEALRAGALTLVAKPSHPRSPDFVAASAAFVSTVRAMAGVKVVRRRPPRDRASSPHARVRVVVVAASTGGPAALHRVLSGLPAGLTAPVLVVQHISPGFSDGLVRWLDDASLLRVGLARDGERAVGGRAYVAPDGLHLEIAPDGHIVLADSAPSGGFRPSADVLFRSAARAYGPGVVAVVLTGMGSDGADGALAVRRAGGRVICQDQASSAVYGMPRAALERGAAEAAVPLADIAGRLTAWCAAPETVS